MDRRQFISTTAAATAVAAASAALSDEAAHAKPGDGPVQLPPDQVDQRFLDTLTTVNDLQVPATVSSFQEQIDSLASPRGLAQSALRLVSGYVNPRGQSYHSQALLDPLSTLLAALAARQNPSGLYDIGNLDSPPDTSFVIADLGHRLRAAAHRRPAGDRAGADRVRRDHAQVRPRPGRGRGAHPEPPLGDLQGAGLPQPPLAEPTAAGPDRRLVGRGNRPGPRGRVQRAQRDLCLRGHQTGRWSPSPGWPTVRGCWPTSAAISPSRCTSWRRTARSRPCTRAGRTRPARRTSGST